MSTPPNANVTGRQQTLTGSWFGRKSNSRPRPPQRQQKRENRKRRKLIVEGQSALSSTAQGSWNVKERFKQDENKLMQEYWGDKLNNKCDNVIRFASKKFKAWGYKQETPRKMNPGIG